jgi:hypothetical protein
MTNNTVPYRAALKLVREASVGLSDWDAETLEMYIDDLYTRGREVGEYALEQAFDVFFTCYYRAGWTLMGRAVNPPATEVEAEVDTIIEHGTDWKECDDFDSLFPATEEFVPGDATVYGPVDEEEVNSYISWLEERSWEYTEPKVNSIHSGANA